MAKPKAVVKWGALPASDPPSAPAAREMAIGAQVPGKAISALGGVRSSQSSAPAASGAQVSGKTIRSLGGVADGKPKPPSAPAPSLFQLDTAEVDQWHDTSASLAAAMGAALAPFWQAQTQMNLEGTHLSGRSMRPSAVEFFRRSATLLGKVSVFVHALAAARAAGIGAVVSDADLKAVDELQLAIPKAQELAASIVG